MNGTSEKEAQWVAGVAARLIEVRSRAGGAPAAVRAEFIREELARALEGCSDSQRKGCVAALLERFPIAGEVVRHEVQATPAPAAPGMREAQSAEELVELLVNKSGSLSEEKRLELGRRLMEAGLCAVDRGSLVMEVGERLTQALQLPAGLQPRLSHVVELLAMLAGMFQRLDQLAMKALLEIRPRGAGGSMAGDFRKGMANYLVGEGELPTAQAEGAERCLAAVVAAMLACGREFGRELADRLSPTDIGRVVEQERKGSSIFGKSFEERCWAKYRESAKDHARAEWLDQKLRETFAAYIEKTLGAGVRGGG